MTQEMNDDVYTLSHIPPYEGEFNLELNKLAKVYPGAATDLKKLIEGQWLNAVQIGGAIYIEASAIPSALMLASGIEDNYISVVEQSY